MPIDPIWLVSGAGALLAAVLALAIVLRQGRRHVDPLPPAEDPPRPATAAVTPGEREAAWAAAAAAELLLGAQREVSDLEKRLARSERAASSTSAELDDLRRTLADADREVTSLRTALDDAETRIAVLEAERTASSSPEDRTAALQEEIERLRAAVARHASLERDLRHRLAAAVDGSPAPANAASEPADAHGITDTSNAASATEPADDLDQQLRELRARIDASHTELERVTAERDALRAEAARARTALTEAREEADRRIAAAAAEVARSSAKVAELERAAGESDRDAARLVVRDAEIADLEARLAALAAARESEVRRLNEKLSSMERLYVDVETRDRRIEQLEEEVKSLAEARDETAQELGRVERELVTLQGAHAEALADLGRVAELERELVEARTQLAALEQSGGLRSEIDRLQKTLAGERDRNARLQRRLSLEAETPAQSTTYAEWDRRTREEIDIAVARAVAPLESRIDRLRVVIDEKERRIAMLAGGDRPNGPDDLTRISGIGPKIRDILHGLGVTTFREIGQFTDEDVERIGAALPVYGRRILDDDWIGQARELAG